MATAISGSGGSRKNPDHAAVQPALAPLWSDSTLVEQVRDPSQGLALLT
jgi:hypothetical protein